MKCIVMTKLITSLQENTNFAYKKLQKNRGTLRVAKSLHLQTIALVNNEN